MTRFPLPLLLTATLTTLGAEATGQRPDRAEAHQHRTHTSTHRVVVVNGKTIVDEKTVNGKRVPSGEAGAAPPSGAPRDLEKELDRLLEGRRGNPELRRLIERLRGELRREGRRGDLPHRPGRGPATVHRSSHTRRVVVENGEVVVDEETRDGKPVPREKRTPPKPAPAKPAPGKRAPVKRAPVEGSIEDLDLFDHRTPRGARRSPRGARRSSREAGDAEGKPPARRPKTLTPRRR